MAEHKFDRGGRLYVGSPSIMRQQRLSFEITLDESGDGDFIPDMVDPDSSYAVFPSRVDALIVVNDILEAIINHDDAEMGASPSRSHLRNALRNVTWALEAFDEKEPTS